MNTPEPEDSLDIRREEIVSKLASLRALMRKRDIEALRLSTVPNVAWLTAGAGVSVNESEERASFSALVTAGDAIIVTDPIEAPRLIEEEHLDALGFEFRVEPWSGQERALATPRPGALLVSDTGVDSSSREIQRALTTQRATLLESEQARLRSGARRATQIVESGARAIHPGMTENEIAGLLLAASRQAAGTAIVTLVGSDERIFRYRHPLPTDKVVDGYVMLVLCLRYRGLVSALTRSVYVGEPPDHLLETALAVARVDVELIRGTVAGHTLGDIYALAARAYADAGQPEAIEQHHQGGPIAYRGREAFATPESDWRIATGQAFAWNPSLRGAKSEDTILLRADGPEVVTRSNDWPVWGIETSHGSFARPAVLTLPK